MTPQEFEIAVEKYRRDLIALAKAIITQYPDAAEDIVNTALTELAAEYPAFNFNGNGNGLRTWFRERTRSRCLDYRKQQAFEKQHVIYGLGTDLAVLEDQGRERRARSRCLDSEQQAFEDEREDKQIKAGETKPDSGEEHYNTAWGPSRPPRRMAKNTVEERMVNTIETKEVLSKLTPQQQSIFKGKAAGYTNEELGIHNTTLARARQAAKALFASPSEAKARPRKDQN